MPHVPLSHPLMLYVYGGAAFIVVVIIVVAWFRHMMRLHSIALIGQEIAMSPTLMKQHITCECCHRHRKVVCYSHNQKETWVCLSCDKLLHTFLNAATMQKSGSLSRLQAD